MSFAYRDHEYTNIIHLNQKFSPTSVKHILITRLKHTIVIKKSSKLNVLTNAEKQNKPNNSDFLQENMCFFPQAPSENPKVLIC